MPPFRISNWLLLIPLAVLPFSSDGMAADPVDDNLSRCAAPAGDPAPHTPEFVARDLQNMYCSEQRRGDYLQHPVNGDQGPELYGGDPYRLPARHDGARFRYQALDVPGTSTQTNPNSDTSAEVYLPCTVDTCPDRPAELPRYQAPFPVVIVFHGFGSDKNHMWWVSQPLAEHGYAVLAVNGTGAGVPAAALDWLASDDNPFRDEMDFDRVGAAGHSLGAENSTRTQGDARVAAIVAYDNCDSPFGCVNSSGSRLHDYPEDQLTTPTLFITADYEHFPVQPLPRTEVPGTLRLTGFERLRSVGIDSMLLTPRATTHLDWAGSFTFGNRYNELISSYFTLAWFDRYLKGHLVTGPQGQVRTTHGRNPAQERLHRQAAAEDAFSRLTAAQFDDSADRYNISQGFWDTQQAAVSGEPMYGGNIPYRIEGMQVADLLSFYYRSVCYLQLPDHTAGQSGRLLQRADSGPDGDMRAEGCTALP